MMILCLVGTNPYSFTRLVSYVDKKLGPKHNVIIQLGNTSYVPKHSDFFKFRKRTEILKLINEADIIISQGGFGSMNDVLSCKKNLIAVPRLIELNESQDDQNELVKYYDSKNFLVACYKVEDIDSIIKKFENNEINLKEYEPESDVKVRDIIKTYLDDNKI